MKKILINKNSWETRIAVVREGKLENIFFGQSTDRVIERSFFKGKVSKILPGTQTAFVDIGQERAGFLHVSEIDRDLAATRMMGPDQLDGDSDSKPRISAEKVDISKVLKEGEDVLVQASKEPVDQKGAKLTTCFTLPGRFIVLTPNIPKVGVSKKIEERSERLRLKEILNKHLPSGMGAVIRTSAEGAAEGDIYNDLTYLISQWNDALEEYKKAEPGVKVHEDMDISLQVLRDHLDDEVESVITDSSSNYASLTKYIKTVAPNHLFKIKEYTGKQSLFDTYDIDKQIDQALKRKAFLKSGGSIVIDTTEALTVIDVNTGRFAGKNNLEDTLLKTNLEAARETVVQLKLRNIGGLIVIDFIDMANNKNRQKLVEYFQKVLKELDKFQAVVLQVSEFGIVQMTRKRSGKTLMRQMTDLCHCCHGLGRLRAVRSESYELLRNIKRALKERLIGDNMLLVLNDQVFDFISSIEFNSIIELEAKFNCHLTLVSDDKLNKNEFNLEEK